jgi:hypothetical protein
MKKYISIQNIMLLICGLLIFSDRIIYLFEERLDIKPPEYLYADVTSYECKDSQKNSYSDGVEMTFETEFSFVTFSCDLIFMNYFQWKGISEYPKVIAHKPSKNSCYDLDNNIYALNEIIDERVNKDINYKYSCKNANNLWYWEVIPLIKVNTNE